MDKKRYFMNIALLFFSTVFSLLTLEISYRIFLFGSDSFSIEKMNSVHGVGFSGFIKPSSHPEIIYELKPNLNAYLKLAPFKTNSRGLRDKEYDIAKPRDTFRVAVIGDSFTMPAGVAIEESYHTLIEERLHKESKGINYQFINFGVGGYSLRQYWGVIINKASEYSPDLIIVGFCPWNDHKIPADARFEQPYKVKPETHPFFESFAKKIILRTLGLKQKRSDIKKTQGRFSFSEQQEKYMRDIFSKMNEFSEGKDISIVIVCLSYRHKERYAKELEKFVLDSGLNFVDVSLPFKGTNGGKYKIYPMDSHPNGKANKIFAEQLYEYLNEHKLLYKNGGH